MRPSLLLMVSVLAAGAAQGTTITVIPNQSFVAGADDVDIVATADVPATWTLQALQLNNNSGSSCSSTVSGTLGAGFKVLRTLPTDATANVIVDAEWQRANLGLNCVRVRACDVNNVCAQRDFSITFTKNANVTPAVLVADFGYGVAEGAPLNVPLYVHHSRLDVGAALLEPLALVEVVDCPEDADDCVPGDLPDWVGMTTSDHLADQFTFFGTTFLTTGVEGLFMTANPPPAAAGRWTFRVRSHMTLEGESNNTIADANPIPLDTFIRGRVSASTDLDFFEAPASAGQSVTVTPATSIDGVCSGSSARISVVNSAGTVLTTHDGCGAFSVTLAGLRGFPTSTFIKIEKTTSGSTAFDWFFKVTNSASHDVLTGDAELDATPSLTARGVGTGATNFSSSGRNIIRKPCTVDGNCSDARGEQCLGGFCTPFVAIGSCFGVTGFNAGAVAVSTDYVTIAAKGTSALDEPECDGSLSSNFAADGRGICRSLFDSHEDFTARRVNVGSSLSTKFYVTASSSTSLSSSSVVNTYNRTAHLTAWDANGSASDQACTDADCTDSVTALWKVRFVRGGACVDDEDCGAGGDCVSGQCVRQNNLFYDAWSGCEDQTYPSSSQGTPLSNADGQLERPVARSRW